MWPVIVRELRAASRAGGNYWLRLLAAGAACTAALVGGLLSMSTAAKGKDVFAALHVTTFCAIWLFVPLVAADCLSRERREGTLGLLFLTPLKPLQITVAKTLTQSVRAFTMWLATLPVLILPVLMGGVTRTEALMSTLINGTSFCLALAIGIWISARSTLFHRSIIAAGCFATVCFLIYLGVNLVAAALVFASTREIFHLDVAEALFLGFVILANVDDTWTEILKMGGFRLSMWLWVLGGGLGVSLVALCVFARRAAHVLEVTWQMGATSGRWARWRERFCTPVIFRNLYRRWLQWSLNTNPVGWLERRTWSSRTVKWAWLAILCGLYGFVVADSSFLRNDFTELQVLLASGLIVSAALSAAGSFRRERNNGVLTLLLVSPLPVEHIVGGRLRGLWSQYVPALCLLFGAWLYLYKTLGHGRDPFWIGFFATCFLAVPVIGLYCSLWQQSFFGALFWTGLLGFAIPLAVSAIVVPIATNRPWLEFHLPGTRPLLLMIAAVAQTAIAVQCLVLLLRKLSQRSFKLPE